MLFITDKMPNFSGCGSVTLQPADPRRVVEALQSGFISLVSDGTTANCLTALLGVTVPTATIAIAPKIGEDTVVLVNVNGTIPAGSACFPANVSIQFSVIDSNKPMFDLKQMKKGIANWLLKDM